MKIPAQRSANRLPGLVILLLLSSCVSNPLRWDNESHVVQSGETVAAIALRYEISMAELIAWNRLDNPDRVYPGQRLRISEPPGWKQSSSANRYPTTRPQEPPPSNWFWPAQGSLVPNRNAAGVGDGINIASTEGSSVFAAAGGKVVYSGSGLSGYGNLIIIKHNETYLSAYGYNQALLVSEGEQVKSGQRIAKMGLGPGKTAMVHFEIRKNGKPVDPLRYLKKTNN